jgi:hypothetical protein
VPSYTLADVFTVLRARRPFGVVKTEGSACSTDAVSAQVDVACLGNGGFAMSRVDHPLPFEGALTLAGSADAAARFAGLGVAKSAGSSYTDVLEAARAKRLEARADVGKAKSKRKTVVNVYEAGTDRPATADAVDEIRRQLASPDEPGPTTPAEDAKRKRTRRTPARKSQPTVAEGLAAVVKDAQADYERGWSDLTTEPVVAKSRVTESAVTSALATLRAADVSRITKTPTSGRTFADAVTDRLQETS